MDVPPRAPVQNRPAGFAAVSRAVVAAAADLVGTLERAVVGDAKVRTARGNAWDALCADRARAQARDEMDRLVRALLADGPRTRAAAAATAAEPTRAPSAAERTTAERVRNAGGSASRTRPATPKRHNGQNQPAAARRTGRGQRAVGSSPRSSASQTDRVSTGSSSR